MGLRILELPARIFSTVRWLGRCPGLMITWICLALFMHFHYFWPTLKRLYVFTDLGKIITACGFIASLGYLFWSLAKSWV